MKGLLLKDWYMAKKYCRAHLFIAVIFLAVSFVQDDNLFFLTYPSIFIATIPTVLLSYDERCKWDEYCGTLPCSKKQIVSEKFIFGLALTIPLVIISGIIRGVKTGIAGSFAMSEVMILCSVVTLAAALVTAVTMPFMIKLGVEKGRIAYYVMIGLATALAVIMPDIISADMSREMDGTFVPMAFAAAVLLYAVSWYLSVKFYEKREI